MPSQSQITQLLTRYPTFFTQPLTLSPYSPHILFKFPHPLPNKRYTDAKIETHGIRPYSFMQGLAKWVGMGLCSEREVVPVWAWRDVNPSVKNVDEKSKVDKESDDEKMVLNVRWVFVGKLRFLSRRVEFEGVDRFTFMGPVVVEHELVEMSKIGESVLADAMLYYPNTTSRVLMNQTLRSTVSR